MVFGYIYKCVGVGGGGGSSVGIATDHGPDDPGSNPGGRRDFPPVQTGPGAHPASCKMGTGSPPGVKCSRDVLLTIHPLLVSQSWKSRVIPLPTSGPQRACNGITLPLHIYFVYQYSLNMAIRKSRNTLELSSTYENKWNLCVIKLI